MPSISSLSSKIRTNISAELAKNNVEMQSSKIANSQLRISTGKQLNSAADNVSGYITSGSLSARNSGLKTAQKLVGDASNVSSVVLDAFENISNLIAQIKDSAVTASASSLGTDEIVALAKSAYRLSEQIQFVVDSTVFGGRQLLYGNYSGNFVVGKSANNRALSVQIDLTSTNADFNISNDFVLNATESRLGIGVNNFGAITNLDLSSLNNVNDNDLGIFSNENVKNTIISLSDALTNVNKAAAYLGGVQTRLYSQFDALNSQITNYNSAISRIRDADIADEQLNLTKSSFLRQTSLISLSQANLEPLNYIRLFAF